MDRPEPAARPGGPARPLVRAAAAVARIVVFVALTLLLSFALGALWSLFGMPDEGPLGFAAYGVIALAALGAGAILIRFMDGRRPAALGIGLSRATPLHLGLGTAIGVAGLVGAVAAMVATGTLRYEAAPGTAGNWLATLAGYGAIFAVAALMEEALFRGYPFQVLARAAGPTAATAVTAVLFAAVHIGNPGVGAFALINIFLAGVLLAVAYLRTLSLWFATALHLGWNWAGAALFDLPVSGITDFETPLYDPVLRGPDWWTGGAFGPEGGLVGTLGFAVALLLVLRLGWVRPDPRIAEAGALVLDREREVA
jgi:uncharacterized protein